jgi:hypothetical protein
MAAELRFSFASPGGRDVVLVPPTAVGEDIDGRFVFVVRDLEQNVGHAKRLTVTAGDLTNDGLEILSGIEDGDILITAGIDRLSDGESVRLWTPMSSGT